MSNSRAVACCLLNISEARNAPVVDRIARAAVAHQLNALPNASPNASPSVSSGTSSNTSHHTSPIQTSVLNVFRDEDYNRSVITLASTNLESLKKAVVDACTETFSLVDLRRHFGGHPRLGAVDLIPLHPLTPDLSVSDCGVVAKEIAETLSQNVAEASFFVFGPGERGRGKSLVQRRKEVGWFSVGGISTPPTFSEILLPDFGSSPGYRLGLTGVGAMPYMMNFNATISTSDSRVGKMAANAVREATGGFPGVRAMAFPHEGNVEVACNVEAVLLKEGMAVPEGMTVLGGGEDEMEKGGYVNNGGGDAEDLDGGGDGQMEYVKSSRLYHATPESIRERIRTFLLKYNAENFSDIRVLAGSTIIGYTPSQMVGVLREAIELGDPLFYLRQTKTRM